ncbi:MAG: hypothetical protein PHF87_10300 [Desulfotomaculaceae bacterium]|nr:hypothetical protein [Desulfotomaculaceae bacterium]
MTRKPLKTVASSKNAGLKITAWNKKTYCYQIERAQKTLDTNPTKISKSNQNDYKHFIKKTSCTPDGEIAAHEFYTLNTKTISAEEAYDGFYDVCTNLEDSAQEIIRINQRRWEI